MTRPVFQKNEIVRLRPGTPWGNQQGTVINHEGYGVEVKLDSGDTVIAQEHWLEHVSYTPEKPADVPKAAPIETWGGGHRKGSAR